MATAAAAQLLDELMGRTRNLLPDEEPREIQWYDEEVCKLYLVKFCPHELFVNTRIDLGPCPKIHDEELKNKFEAMNTSKKAKYEDDFIKFCHSLIAEVDKKIGKGKDRLARALSEDATNISAAQHKTNEEQIILLTEKINALVSQAEEKGCAGDVEEAQGLLKLCDQLREERETLRRKSDNFHWQQTAELAAAQEKQMEVCEICGAFLIVGDAQQRIDDHLMGKLHMGYAKLRVAINEIKEARQKEKEEKAKMWEKEREERRKRFAEEEEKKRKERGEDPSSDRDRERRNQNYRSSNHESELNSSRERDREDRERGHSRRSENHDRKCPSTSRSRSPSMRERSREDQDLTRYRHSDSFNDRNRRSTENRYRDKDRTRERDRDRTYNRDARYSREYR